MLPPVRVHCFSTGHVRPKAAKRGLRRYFSDGWADHALPVNVFAIEHPAGLCLFDTGQEAAAARPGYFPRWHPFYRLSRFELEERDEAGAQLQKLGLAPTDVRWVVLSHLHTDHVGGLGGFTHAEVLVSQVEWQRARGIGRQIRGYLPKYWPGRVEPRLIEFIGPALGPFPASEDLEDDGRLLLVPTPGHTPGHMGLLAWDGRVRVLLGGDMASSAEELERRAPDVADFCRRESVLYLATHDPDAARLAIRANFEGLNARLPR
jgi:glyoxylase-like metal-dependent hydrolase (beta-lactamase superfamily II)